MIKLRKERVKSEYSGIEGLFPDSGLFLTPGVLMIGSQSIQVKFVAKKQVLVLIFHKALKCFLCQKFHCFIFLMTFLKLISRPPSVHNHRYLAENEVLYFFIVLKYLLLLLLLLLLGSIPCTSTILKWIPRRVTIC